MRLRSKTLQRHLGARQTRKRIQQRRELIRREAAIGGTLFGPVPDNIRREFVCINKTTWLWHEEWVDEQNVWHMSTTRYDIRPDGIYKMQDGGTYQPVNVQESQHLRAAALLYNEHMQTILYSRPQRI